MSEFNPEDFNIGPDPIFTPRSYNKFQISKIIGGWNVCIRTDSYKELCDAMKEVKPLISTLDKEPENRPITAQSDVMERHNQTQEMCPIHGVPLTHQVSKRTGNPYKGHFIQGEGMCIGKPKQ